MAAHNNLQLCLQWLQVVVFRRETRTWSLEKEETNRRWQRVLRKHPCHDDDDDCLDGDNDDWICEELETVLNGRGGGGLTKKDRRCLG